MAELLEWTIAQSKTLPDNASELEEALIFQKKLQFFGGCSVSYHTQQ